MTAHYFRLLEDVHALDRWHLGEVESLGKTISGAFLLGRPHAGQELPTTAQLRIPGVTLDFCLTDFAVPVASRAVASVIAREAGKDLQRIPVLIPGSNRTDSQILNATRLVRCLDEQASEFSRWTENDGRPDKLGHYRGVTRLRIDRTLVPEDASFFRIEGWPIALIVCHRVKEAMEAAGCLGAKFAAV